ncbi:YbaB/EbfC family DNA-binding protein [Amycolatopsis acidicola]|uniref:YbaB/EbfC family DNA-binding protein n=1 Tax=Amycolatopsis acidicola TaxID=2596893 RepID=A0A5N0UHV0_9PSEU|nr:YbaB/EbfC family nucleoid-associated protein [Amycolatopsis acidicola]KAA9148163.1 YbaB/EbfC family DNA-binding protein [Amycolatopsis acidicola]
MTITGTARRDGVSVEVAPGGALRSLELSPEALRSGGAALSRTILGLVKEAAARANERAKHAVATELGEVAEETFEALGFGRDATSAETAEATTPDSWRA